MQDPKIPGVTMVSLGNPIALHNTIAEAVGEPKLCSHATTPAEFAALWDAAKLAGQAAALTENAKLGPEQSRGLDCGFAWVSLPGNTPFARWAKKQGIASRAYPHGLQIWYSKCHSLGTQSVSVHEAACRAVRDVLSHGLQTSTISMGSRLD